MKIILALLFLGAATLSGCATTKNWQATGGSRSDGVIKLSYEYGLFKVPQVSQTKQKNLQNHVVLRGVTLTQRHSEA